MKQHKLNKFKKEDIILYEAKVTEARLASETITDFFAKYSHILQDIFKVTIKFAEFPDRVIDQNSSHCSPIGRPYAWTQEQKDDPSIPNTYKAYNGFIEGSLISNDGPYMDSKFEGFGLFWKFSDLSLDFANGTPNGGRGRGKDFSVELILFLEDFPLIYRGYRKVDHIERANAGLSLSIDEHKKEVRRIHRQMVSEDPKIASIDKQIEEIEKVKRYLLQQKSLQDKAIKTKSEKAGLPLPKIENRYLDLDRYNKLRRETEAPIEMVSDDTMNNIYKKVTSVNDAFEKYQDEFACDFL